MSPSPASFRKALLAWYAVSGRHDLPWREGAASPYHVLVSEFMLQQTTVATVIPYYHRFLKTFPTMKALADASLERVLELWSGLGYYARARNLHAAAQKIVAEHGGRLPRTRAEVEELPGVGPYTAGALLSFAYDRPEALVDGNVIRVLARIYGLRENVKEPRTLEKIWSLAWKLVPPRGARAFNSALMDLGATVCRPSAPDCLLCPFFKLCAARRSGRPEDLPLSEPDRPKKTVRLWVGLVEKDGRWALARRPAKGLYGGLWEFPGVEGPAAPGDGAVVEGALRRQWDLPVEALAPLPELRHVLTHRDIRLHPWRCRWTGGGAAWERGEWRSRAELESMGISSLTRRLAALL